MNDNSLKDIKYKRVKLYWDELSRHRIDPDTSLDFMEYTFCVSREYLMQIIKGYHSSDDKVVLEHADLDLQCIDAFARKLYKTAKSDRQMKLF